MRDSLGDRMKTNYEDVYRISLPRRMPYVIRLDGKSFHTFTRGLDRPFDEGMFKTMASTTHKLCGGLDQNLRIQNAKLAYMQSDEISILCTDYDELGTAAWFDKNIQKMVSVAASMASVHFNHSKAIHLPTKAAQLAVFDARTFVLPKEEVCNYFVWRQQDATRNSIQGLGQKHFSHKELHGLNCNEIQEKLFSEKRINWDDTPTKFKRGMCVVKVGEEWVQDTEIPIFTQDRNYIERFI